MYTPGSCSRHNNIITYAHCGRGIHTECLHNQSSIDTKGHELTDLQQTGGLQHSGLLTYGRPTRGNTKTIANCTQKYDLSQTQMQTHIFLTSHEPTPTPTSTPTLHACSWLPLATHIQELLEARHRLSGLPQLTNGFLIHLHIISV